MPIVLRDNFNSQFIGHNIPRSYFFNLTFIIYIYIYIYIVIRVFEKLWCMIHNDYFLMSSQDTTLFLFFVGIIQTQVHYLTI